MERDTLVQNFHKMLEMGLFIDTLLVNTIWQYMQPGIHETVLGIVENLFSRYVNLESLSPNLGKLPYSTDVARFCLQDTVVATACLIAHEGTGTVYPSLSDIDEAHVRVEQFLLTLKMENLYKIYLVITGHDVIQPHLVHKNITEAEFIRGIRHYPYNSSQLNLFLLLALIRDIFRLKWTAGGRVVQLTKFGQNRYALFDGMLKEVKYMEMRISMSYVYQFDHIQDFNELCDRAWPDSRSMRRSFVDFTEIEPDCYVLEVGCGTGALTYEGGLHRAIGKNGKLTAIDVSFGMLEQARREQRKYDILGQIDFVRASVENLPFTDDTFSVSIGCSFLHFTNAVKSLSEMKRVVIPGGTISILQVLDFGLNQPFFRDWFEPIFEIAKRNCEDKPRTYLPDGNQLSEWFHVVGIEQIEIYRTFGTWLFDDPETTVQHIVRAVSFFQHELMTLPWTDRKSIVTELIDRGRDVCRRYSLAERTISVPSIFIKGKKPTYS